MVDINTAIVYMSVIDPMATDGNNDEIKTGGKRQKQEGNQLKKYKKRKQEVETNLKEHKLKKRGKIRKMKCWSSLFAGFLMVIL